VDHDFETRYRAVQSRDARFDGRFVVAVGSTGIYCRPSCPAVTPKRGNVRFLASPAAAQSEGFRACLRCRPDAAPGSPEWDTRADLAGRAMRMIADGVVDREGVPGLARRLSFSERHVNRQLARELGAGPLALARAQRAQTARILVESTDLRLGDVAAAAGFASVRQFNDTVRRVYATTPGELRRRARRALPPAAPGAISLRLAHRAPFAAGALLDFLGARAVPGVEERDGQTFRRALRLPHGPAVAELTPAADHVRCTLRLADMRDLPAAVARCRRLLDLDADAAAVDAALAADASLRPLVSATPGLRVPGAVDGPELLVRALLGQAVSVAAARALAGRVAEALGEPLPEPLGGVTRTFPTPAALADAPPALLPVPARRADAIRSAAAAVAAGDVDLDPGADRERAAAALVALPGVGPWTAGYVRMRALGDPDAWPAGDLVLRRQLARLGEREPEAPRRWRPWRAYAAMHLWHAA
jgi:AraC family transcriptional regulator of adaptative response / DNA-3-methyladenine glycosylase II